MTGAEAAIVQLGITFGLKTLQWWLSETPPAVGAKRFDQTPTVAEGDRLSLSYGRVRITRAALAWHSRHIRQRDPSEFDDPSGDFTSVGAIESGVNMLFNLGMAAGPVATAATAKARLIGFYIGDSKLDVSLAHRDVVTVSPGFSPLADPTYFRLFRTQVGDPRGIVQFFAGTSDQQLSDNDTLAVGGANDITNIASFIRIDALDLGMDEQNDPTLISGYRGQMLVSLTGKGQGVPAYPGEADYFNLTEFYFGNSGTLPPISFEVAARWSFFGSDGASAAVVGDMNPIDVIYDLLINPLSRLGLDVNLIDSVSFVNVAATLDVEGHGFSYCFQPEVNALEAIKMVVDQAGLALYFDQSDNQIKVAAIRDDYDAATIPHFGVDHVSRDQQPEYRIGGWNNVTNQVEVIYTDRFEDYARSSVVRQNQSSSVVQSSSTTDGRMRTTVIEYPGCNDRTLALKLADRDLSYLSQPLATIKLTLSRLVDLTGNYSAADLRPGGVFKLTLPTYGIDEVVFRVERVDPGQLGANAVVVEATQDPFFVAAGGEDEEDGSVVGYLPVPTPINHRHVEEAPRWMLQRAAAQGIIDSADKQRIWVAAYPDDGSPAFRAHSAASLTYASDVPEVPFQGRVTLQTTMTREAEPYDDVTPYDLDFGADGAGVVANRAGTWDPDDIRNDGRTLFIIDDEIMAYEILTDMGGGAAQVFKIWRGLLDTPVTEHAIGADVWLVGVSFAGLSYIGRRAWPQLAGVSVKLLAHLGLAVGSGGDPSDTIDFRLRTMRQYPVQNLGICGEVISGTSGLPSQAATAPALGYFKSATLLEEDIVEVAYKTRDRNNVTILRGDDGSEDPTDIVVGGVNVEWRLSGQKGDADEVTLCDEISADGNSGTELHALLGAVGHGDIDVIMHTVKTTPAGKYGIPAATSVVDEWDAPRIRVWAPHWRNLLANCRWSYAFDSATAAASGNGRGFWNVVSGTPNRGQSTSSLTRSATGWYAIPTAATGTAVFRQDIDISGYDPRGMRCGSWFHVRNLNADAADTIAIDVIALNAAGATLATQSLAAFAAPTTTWRKVTIAHSSLPADTAKLRIVVNQTGVGDTSPDTALTEVSTYVGDFIDDVISGPSFDASGAGWTNVVNSFAYPTTLPLADRNGTALNYAQGGAFASSEIRQDYTVPAGREFGTFVLRFWRMNEGNNDTGDVIIEARDGGGVLSSTSTGVEFMATQNVWFARRLYLELPDGTTTVRVRLLANRAAGAGNSGASFDEMHGQLHQDLDPAYERELLLSSPTVQQMPATWQTWHTSYPDIIDDGIRAPLVIGPQAFASQPPSTPVLRLRWSDDATRAADVFVGQWGDGRGSINGTRFARQSGAGALDLQSTLEQPLARPAAPTSDDSFSVVVFFRIDESGFASTCGIVGRCDGNSGWELTIDATGHVEAVLRGDAGNAVATRAGSTVHDGAVHMAALVYDAVAQTLTVHDERGDDSVSTAAIGEIRNTTASTVLRVGRSRSTIDTIPGVIGPVYYFHDALTAAHLVGQSSSIWQYGLDPTDNGLTTSRTVAHFVDGPANDDGCTLALMSSDQLALGYYEPLGDPGDEYVGQLMGLALCRGSTNLVPSWNFAGASWTVDGGVSLVQSIVDPTGRQTGVSLIDINVGVGFKVIGLALGATATMTVVFYARAETGTPNIDVQLMNASDVVKQTVTLALSTQWQRYLVSFTAWDASTPTGRIRWKANAAKINIDLGGVVYACQGTDVPTLFDVAAAGTLADVYATLTETFPLELNAQGEIVAEGVGYTSSPAVSGSIVSVENGSNNNNARELIANTTSPRLSHYDATAPTNVTSTGSAIDWNQFWKLRGRWCAAKMLDDTVDPYAGIVVDGDVDSAVYGRTTTFSYSAVANDLVQLGKGPSGNSPLSCYLRRVVVRAREEKLP